MIIYRHINPNPDHPPSVVTVGSFDGVHLGHRAILDRVVGQANRESLASVAVTFNPHPRKVVGKSDQSLQLLSSLGEKLARFRELGFSHSLVIPFDREFAALSSIAFLERLHAALHIKHFVLGYDHHFGHNREGGLSELKEQGARLGFSVEQVGPFELGGTVSSSTLIRRALEKGEVDQAALFLGRPYEMRGHVVRGDGRGRQLGFPTANIELDDPDKLVPARGVYAVDVCYEEQWYKGMMNIGVRPTFEFDSLTLEVNLFNFEASIYNEKIVVRLKHFVRPEKKFASVEALREQLEKDKTFCENV